MSKYNNKPVGFLLFEDWHNRKEVGSSRLRGHWLMKHWEEAEIFQNGAFYDTVIFQKAYWLDYVRAFKGIKILDICDPDWLDSMPIKEVIDNCDAVTVSSEGLKHAIEQFTDKPVVFIPDRQDLSFHTKKKEHKGKAKKVIWFGYSHNAKLLDPTLLSLKKLGLELTVLSDARPPYNGATRNIKYQYEDKNWSFDDVILEHDIVLLPPDIRPRGKYKSTNKTLTAWTLGMPVATNKEDLIRFMEEAERVKEGELRYNEVREKWNIEKSVQEYKDLIAQIKNGKTS